MLLLWSVLYLISAGAHDLYRAVLVGQNHYLIVRNHVVRLISDPESLELLDPFILPEMSLKELKSRYDIGEPLPRVAYSDKQADDCVRIYLLKSSIMNGDDLFINYSSIGEYMNPSIFVFRGRLLVVVPLQVGLTGSERRKATGTIEFKWLNCSKYPFYTTEEYLGISNEVRALNRMFVGEDPRALYFNDSYAQIYYTSNGRWLGRHHQKMGVAEIRFLAEENRINITYLPELDPGGGPIVGKQPIDNSINQKNWSPFLHNGEVLLIQSIHPFIVVQLHGYGTRNLVASIKLRVDYAISQKLGDYRGGTNALLLPGSTQTYISFYHIRTRLPWSSMGSYVYGAYTFTLNEPAGLVKISPTPIMEPRELFHKSWASRFIDYCVYPMHIFLENAVVLHISFGYQDRWGFVGTMNLTRLLDTLVPVI